MAWTSLSFPFGSTLTSTKMTQLYDNITAQANGDSGAPKTQTAALEQGSGSEAVTAATIRDGAVGQAAIATNGVAQAELAADCVGQSEIKEATQSVTASTTGGEEILLSGGYYHFMAGFAAASANNNWTTYAYESSVTYQSRIELRGDTGTAYWRSQYIQASPPYDLGDGEIPLFVFLKIDKTTGDIVTLSMSPEAPWHHNGPTNTKADMYTKDGRGFRKRRDMSGYPYTFDQVKDDPLKLQDYMIAFNNAPVYYEEITQEIKNKDMLLIPHPFLKIDTAKHQVILLDPVSDLVRYLADLEKSHDQFEATNILVDKKVIIDNTPIPNRAGPPGVPIHTPKWKVGGV